MENQSRLPVQLCEPAGGLAELLDAVHQSTQQVPA